MLASLKASRRWPLWARLTMATACLLLAHLFQVPLENQIPGEPFLLFFLVVMGLTLAFGQGVGLFGVALSGLLSVFFFEPSGTFALHSAADLVKIELYAILAACCVIALERLSGALIAADEAARILEQSERANSVLLRELAHRVTNNFAVVASLIRGKAHLIGDAGAKSVLNEAVEQVMVLARVHSRLRAESDDIVLDSSGFLQELCRDLEVLIAPGRPLSITCRAVDHRLSVTQAIPLGLIVNELVTNALKHAFPDGRPGAVRVNLEEIGNHLRLSVEDDGIGLDGGRPRGTGTGLTLIRALCQQLGGSLEVESASDGTRFVVAFPSAAADAAPPVRGAIRFRNGAADSARTSAR